jgi:DNA-binding NarL/FixJ family response regulator
MTKIFLIEDNLSVSKMIQKTIVEKFSDIKIVPFESVERALGNINEKPDYIILDHFLDKVNGIDSIPVFKEFLPDAKIIVVSSQNDIQAFENAFSFGASEYIRKDALLLNNITTYLKKDIEKKTKSWYNSVTQILKTGITKKKVKTIYILDDNLSTSYFTRHILEFESYNTVLLFSNPEDFLIQMKKLNPDVAIIEHNLDGKEISLIQQVRLISPETSILIFSDQKEVSVAAGLLNAGASHYLTKSNKNVLKLKSMIN